jgi:hypothetical protein
VTPPMLCYSLPNRGRACLRGPSTRVLYSSGNAPNSRFLFFHGFDGIFKRLCQNASANGTQNQAEESSLEGLALAYDDDVNVGQIVGTASETERKTFTTAPKPLSTESRKMH